MDSGRQCWAWSTLLVLVLARPAGAQAAVSAPYAERGREVEAHQRALTGAVTRLHDAIAVVLRRDARDLLPRLEPPPPIATGYQLLPRLVASAQTAPTAAQPLSYGWNWSDTLIAREQAVVGSIEAQLGRATPHATRPLADSLIVAYRGLVERKKRIDADVGYNWLWQVAYARDSAAFQPGGRLEEETKRATPPAFVSFRRDGRGWILGIPVVTDIEDSTFLDESRRAVESAWRADGDSSYQVKLGIRRMSPATLYCRDPARPGCVPPAKGAAIDLARHLALFPPDVAVLTTGAASTHVIGGRAIVLSPYELPERTLAHEFGHLLGLPDAYVRTFRDAGRDGFVITEVVPDPGDIMANPKTGSVQRQHFERLLAVRDIPDLMRAGLDALYVRHEPAVAAARFRDVLSRDAGHYGAVFQLATALGQLGDTAQARPLWVRVLAMALAYGDSATARTARERLGQR